MRAGKGNFKWKPSNSELYGGIITMDSEGLSVKQDNGSTQMTSREVRINNANDQKQMSLFRGMFNAYNWENGKYLGALTPYKNSTTGDFGLSILNTLSCKFFSVGRTDAVYDTDTINKTDYFKVCVENIESGAIEGRKGTHILNAPLYMHQTLTLNNNNIRDVGTMYLYNDRCRIMSEGENTKITGANNVVLGQQRADGSFYKCTEFGYGVKNYTDWDFGGRELYNVKVTSSAYCYPVINTNAKTDIETKKTKETFEEIEILSPLNEEGVKILDVSNVSNRSEILADDNNADLGKLVILLFDEVKKLKEDIRHIKSQLQDI